MATTRGKSRQKDAARQNAGGSAAKAALNRTNLLAGTVEVAGVDMPLCASVADQRHAEFIPHLNPGYIFRNFAYDFCCDLLDNETIMLVGLPSTGKSSLPEQVAARTRTPLFYIDCEEDTKLSHIIGEYKYIKGEMVWVDGPLTTAMRNGYVFVLNEYDYASSGVLGGLNGVFLPITKSNPVRRLVLAEHGGEVVRAHPNFRIVATCNSLGNMQKHRKMFPNARPQNYATLGRFKFYTVTFMTQAEETEQMMREFDFDPSVREYIAKFARLAADCRVAFDAGEMPFLFQTRHLSYMLKHLRRHKDRYQKNGVEGIDRVLDAAQRILFPLCQEDVQLAITGYIKSIFN